jgi:hypothetical protein
MWFNNSAYGNPFQFSGTVEHVSTIDENGKIIEEVLDTPEALVLEEEARTNSTALGFFEPRDLVNGLYIHLISPDRGILYYTPVMLLGLLGAGILYRKNSTFGTLLISIVSLNLLVYSMWGDPWGGWAFGSRYMIPSYALLAVCIGVLLSNYKRNLLVLSVFSLLLMYSVSVNTLGAITTSQNPPKVEVLALEELSGVQERYSYDRNFQLVQQNVSKSFLWQNYFNQFVTAYEYLVGIVSLIVVPSVVLIGLLFLRGGKKNEAK